ncbi:MAG: S4 domain-containing protein [Caldimonas sp.]
MKDRPDAPRPPAGAPIASLHADGSLRLSKRMSELGLASRREADEWIARGWVRVDGRVVSELGSRVVHEQRITIDGARATRRRNSSPCYSTSRSAT